MITLKEQLSNLPKEIEITISLENEIKDLLDFELFVFAISIINQDDELMERGRWRYRLHPYWFIHPNEAEELRKRFPSPKLLMFRINSPPEFSILADPAWLAVFISILIGYKQAKESIQELGDDVHSFIDRIAGLTIQEKEIIEQAVNLYLEQTKDRYDEIIEWIKKTILGRKKTTKSVKVTVKKNKKGAQHHA